GRGHHAQGMRQRRWLVDHHGPGQRPDHLPPVRARQPGARRSGHRPDRGQHRRHLVARRAVAEVPARRAVRGARRPGRGGDRLARDRGRAGTAGLPAMTRASVGGAWRCTARRMSGALLLAALLGAPVAILAETGAAPARKPEPNTLVPAGDLRYAPAAHPDRIIASPAQDPARGFLVSWRTSQAAEAPVLELVVAGDSPDVGEPRRLAARSGRLDSETGAAH